MYYKKYFFICFFSICLGALHAIASSELIGNNPLNVELSIEAATTGETLLPVEDPKKKERIFVKLIKEIAKKYDIRVDTFTNEWNMRLKRGDEQHFIHYYDFGLNSASSFKICEDKTVTSDILSLEGIPHIEHKMFLHPSFEEYVPTSGVWESVHAFCSKHNYNIVIKPTSGSGGEDVFHTLNQRELEKVIHGLFAKKTVVSISPFYNITSEYRIIMLNNEPQLVYRKVVPFLEGDGVSDLKTLFIKYLGNMDDMNFNIFFKKFDSSSPLLIPEKILATGEKYPLKWKHNLQQGAIVDLNIDKVLKNKLENLALATVKALDIKFASVDIAEIEQELKVMEVNTGIMMKCFMQQLGEKGYNIAKTIYEKAICSAFKIDPKLSDND